MDKCYYVSGVDDSLRFNLDGDGTYIGTAEGLRGREWTYSLGVHNISAVARNARGVSVDAVFLDESDADTLRHIADRDVRKKTAGRIYVGSWFQRAYITACEPDTIYHNFHTAKLSIALLDGAWSKEQTQKCYEWGEATILDGIDLPYDLPYDLGYAGNVERIKTESMDTSPVRLVIYGATESPTVTIGGNVYAADVDVPFGGRLEIDGLTKTATLYDQAGNATDVFSSVHRSSGLDGGEYAFQPLPEGESAISWDGTFSFDIIYYIQEGEPPWELS